MQEVELSTLDLRYERYRMRNPALEGRLLDSIRQRGIEEPLEGVDSAQARILLNGFKRVRCARRLGIETVPYLCLSQDEAAGILALLRGSNERSLSILEQAGFVDQLRERHHMNVAEIAQELSRSKGWVIMRLGLISDMTPAVRQRLMDGSFPVYAYMYTVLRFMRMNALKSPEVEPFVLAVSGHRLSVREIEQLAHGYFRGPESFRQQLQSGQIAASLDRIRTICEQADGCSGFERGLLNDLEIAHKFIRRLIGKSHDRRARSRAFFAEANLLTAALLSLHRPFVETVRHLHDRSGQA